MTRPKGIPNKPKEQSIDCYKAVATITTNALLIEEKPQSKPLYGDKKYRLLIGVSKEDLTDQVCIFLDTGYMCQGGVSVTNYRANDGSIVMVYCQGIIRKE